MNKGSTEWPEEAQQRYEKVEVLGKGSFGMVWMARRIDAPRDEFDDEFVAIKNIQIKDEKGKVYAEREIAILEELRHPNVIRLIKAFPVYGNVRVVIMQLARGPNLHQLVVKRGALGLPLSRLVSRHLIAAVSYLHGRACLHRDIKPSNCILACQGIHPTEDYDWFNDDAIWSNRADAEEAVRQNKWKLMLVDFGFARALESSEVKSKKHLRNSIVYEATHPDPKPKIMTKLPEHSEAEEDGDDDAAINKLVESAAASMRHMAFEPTNVAEEAVMGTGTVRRRESGVSMSLPEPPPKTGKRMSTARQHVRSMSALGTKAYAAPEIRRKLRHKTEEDFEKENAAMTECVADYGMIVDAYSVGWTLRVAMTGVPPNFTMSEYMRERENVRVEGGDDDDESIPECCLCFMAKMAPRTITIRDPAKLPKAATFLIRSMTEKNPEDRMTVREAQCHPWIAGEDDEDMWSPPQGDVPSSHGDPVVPLKCAEKLSKLTIEYHMQ